MNHIGQFRLALFLGHVILHHLIKCIPYKNLQVKVAYIVYIFYIMYICYTVGPQYSTTLCSVHLLMVYQG